MFGIDPKAFLGGDLKSFADQLQGAADGGQFNPLSMFTGESQLHSVFLAPLTPQVQSAIKLFSDKGSGPFAGIPQQIRQQDPSIDQATAQQRARELLTHAQGFCVVLLENEQGLRPMPHLFFGALPDDFIDALAAACADPALTKQVKQHLLQLREKAATTQILAQQCYVNEEFDEAGDYWCDVAERLCQGLDEGIIPAARDQLADLGFWIASNMIASRDEFDGDELLLHARCCCLAGELESATQSIAHIFEDYEPDEEDMIPVCEQLGQLAITQGKGRVLEQCFIQHHKAIDSLFHRSYEMALLRFRLLSSSMASEAELLSAAQRMFSIDAKSCRHDLNKEPVWIITKKPTGTMMDTADAANALDRSLQFIGKRLENGTLPFFKDGEQFIIPEAALLAWLKVMTELKLLD